MTAIIAAPTRGGFDVERARVQVRSAWCGEPGEAVIDHIKQNPEPPTDLATHYREVL